MKKILFLSLMLGVVISGCTVEKSKPATEDTSKESNKQIAESKTTAPESKVDWAAQIKEVSGATDLTETEKADKIEGLARKYTKTVSETELNEFQTYVVNEYKSKAYLTDIKNDEYMLTNIFKAVVIEKHYDDSEQLPIDKFAFDFYQNSKYTYRGADTVDSDSVKSNEKQMNKALEQIK
ncbi:hypothetical protein [Paenibacillus sp. MMS18-CY102]|uniref:hypothetical protein n=1 Tax=Paenibacillus sp. MMS18-CY102 TaxID=2682849 RepID=UPI0013653E08|nr:hypothetical protein [Paenibacillus sp. MMS18-CY102]MWC26620.1 hypothetical protein [Paenibacillus sp. MMS18-CY102]